MADANRVVVYYQTQYDSSLASNSPFGHFVSPLPLALVITHIIVAAVHLNTQLSDPLHLNNFPPTDARFTQMWTELASLKSRGVKVMAMLGGAAPGSYTLLSGTSFDTYYPILSDFIRQFNIDGLDLDVEQSTALSDIERLISRLKQDFGQDFIVTLAPVASALEEGSNLSGFDYIALERSSVGPKIDWYNAQFYSGFGSISPDTMYINIVNFGPKLDPSRLVAGTLTNPADGGGFTPINQVTASIEQLVAKYGARFGGVAGWEYFNSLPDSTQPWQWATVMTNTLQQSSESTEKPQT